MCLSCPEEIEGAQQKLFALLRSTTKRAFFTLLSLKRVAEKGSEVSHPVCRREMRSALTLLLRNDDLCPRLSNISARNYSQRVSGSSGKSGPLQMLTQVSRHRGLIFQPDENVILWVSS